MSKTAGLFFLSLRPKQWTKNLFILASLIFTGHLGQPGAFAVGLAAVLLFSLFSGSLYVFNDVRDVASDRLHPVKSQRPFASGRLAQGPALAMAAGLASAALALSFLLKPQFGWAVAAYGALMLTYTLALKRVLFVDVIVIAVGFALRLAAGAFVLGDVPTHWSLICVFFLTLFLGFSKRNFDLVIQTEKAGAPLVLKGYQPELLRMLITVTAACTVLAYCLFTLTSGKDIRLVYTLPFVVFGVLKYIYLVMTPHLADFPEELFWKDVPLLTNNLLWIASCAAILYGFKH